MLSRSLAILLSSFVVLFLLPIGNLNSELPRGPFPLVLLDERIESGRIGQPNEEIRFPLTSDYAGALNFRINQDETEELQNEQQIITNPLNPDNLVAVWRDFRLGYRRVGVAYSFDGGLTWTEDLLEEPTYPWHSDPGLTVDARGNFYAVILSFVSTFQENGLFVYTSTDGGVTWGDPVPVVNGVPNVFEDKELIGCDRTGGAYDGNLYVVWARFGWGSDIMVSRSTDGGQSFLPAIDISDGSDVQWPVPVVGADGTVFVAWCSYSPLGIRLDKSTDGGVTFGPDRTLANVSFYPGGYINGGITVFPYPAMDADITGGANHGNLYVAYLDYGVGSDTDIFFKRSTDSGGSWSSAMRINDDAEGNGRDQFHPWITIDETGLISVVFLDRRNDPGNYYYDLYMTQSSDGGISWSGNVRISDISSDPQAGQIRAGLLGEYIGVTSANGRVNPLWTDTRNGHQDAFTARIYTNPAVDAVAIPEATSFQPGDDLTYTLRVINRTGESVDLTGAGYITLPWGDPMGMGPIDGPLSTSLGPYETRELRRTEQIPVRTPAGTYYYTLRIWQSTDQVIDEATFPFTVEIP
jgi:hypothetical protein